MSVSLQLIEQFVKDIEDTIYKNELIYRSILVVKNNKESKLLKSLLEKKDYSVAILGELSTNIDYNAIDERIVLVTFDKFKTFVLQLQRSAEGLQAYNFIGLSYLLDNDTIYELKHFYISITNNNANDTIILDKDYLSLLYLKNIVT
jgi:hypothetical protein